MDFLLTYPTIYLPRPIPFFVAATGYSFGAILTLNSSNDVPLQKLHIIELRGGRKYGNEKYGNGKCGNGKCKTKTAEVETAGLENA